jgi:response regulator RpfG family c-di-GMP phosphodiesterase
MDRKKILVIDDDADIRNLCADILEKENYRVFFASNGREGVNNLERDNFDLVLLDIQMPFMNGFDFMSAIKKKDKNLPVIVITGFGTVDNAVRALKSGASDFIVKPFDVQNLLQTVKDNLDKSNPSGEISKLRMVETILELNRVIVSLTGLDLLLEKVISIVNNIFQPEGVAIYLAEDGNFILRKHISDVHLGKKFPVSYNSKEVSDIFTSKSARTTRAEEEIVTVPLFGKEKNIGFITLKFPDGRRKIKESEIKFLEVFATQASMGIENANLFDAVKNSYLNSIRSLVNSLEARDAYTKGHSAQVAYYSFLIGKQLGLTGEELEILRNASYLHDLGKLGIKDEILLKPGPLSEKEMELIRKHPEITVKILEPLGLRKEEMDACFYHHERIDGRGYPKRLKGEEIPLFAKILSVADAYSAMISERPYRKSFVKQDAVAELKKWAGVQFDNNIVGVFVKLLEENENEGEKDG